MQLKIADVGCGSCQMKMLTDSRDHIHTVVRTPNGNDHGKDLLRQHYERFDHRHDAYHHAHPDAKATQHATDSEIAVRGPSMCQKINRRV